MIKKFVLDFLNYLSALFIFAIFVLSTKEIIFNYENALTLRLWGNHVIIYFFLSFVAITLSVMLYLYAIMSKQKQKYIFLKSSLLVLFITYFHELLWFFYTIPHMIYTQNLELALKWWLYGVLVNTVIILVLSFFINVRVNKWFYMYYTLVWFIIAIVTYNAFNTIYIFSSDGYTQSNALLDNALVNFIEIGEWGIYLALINLFIDFKFSKIFS